MAIVIVGGGHAGGQAAASLRQEGYEGSVTIVTEENYIPYQRPPLSKQYLSGEFDVNKVYLRPEKFYETKGIEIRTGLTVNEINRKEHELICNDKTVIRYEKLLLATGARARTLDISGSELSGIHSLRTIKDVDAIRVDMAKADSVTIIGGGYIGLEVAAVAIEAGKQVTVLEMEDRILERVATPEMSQFYYELHRSKGVNILTNCTANSFQGNGGEVSSVHCSNGLEVASDLVIVGVGIVPNVEIAENAGIKTSNGILVNEYCLTSDPNIFAAGDCTNHPNPLLERRLRLESVPNAMEQARVASANMLISIEKPNAPELLKAYASIPWFWSDQYNLKFQMVGFPTDSDEVVTRGNVESEHFANFYFTDNAVIAADAINSPREFMLAKQLIGKTVDKSALADPNVDLKTLATK